MGERYSKLCGLVSALTDLWPPRRRELKELSHLLDRTLEITRGLEAEMGEYARELQEYGAWARKKRKNFIVNPFRFHCGELKLLEI